MKSIDNADLNSKEFWLDFAQSKFNITDEARIWDCASTDVTVLEQAAELFEREGYLHLKDYLREDYSLYVELIKKMFTKHIPPVFALVYDEVWCLQAKLKNIVEYFLGSGSKLIPSLWIWHVDSNREQEILQEKDKELQTRTIYSGFYGPHRDKGKKSLYPDGKPKILSFWLPLSKATPLNSCIYVVPADRDPTYMTEDQDSWKFKRADIRALPAEPGDVLFWNQSIVHWASRAATCRDDIEPRISMGFEYVDAAHVDKVTPNFEINSSPDFKTRLEVIAAQFKLYVTEQGFPSYLLDFIRANDGILRSGREVFL